MRSDSRLLVARRPARLLPPLLWMGVIALGSSSLVPGDQTGRFVLTVLGRLAPWASAGTLAAAQGAVPKLWHLVEYGILAVLWHRAFAGTAGATTAAFGLAVAYGGLDELWQGLQPTRTPALSDVAIDATGALLGLAAWTGPGPLAAATLRAVAWGAGLLAALGLALLALDWCLGRGFQDLLVGTVGLGATAWACARVSRAWRRRR
jgi:VanZ family protein